MLLLGYCDRSTNPSPSISSEPRTPGAAVAGLIGSNRPGTCRATPFARRHKPSSDKSEKGSLCRFARGGTKLGFDLYDPDESTKKPYQATNRGGFLPIRLGRIQNRGTRNNPRLVQEHISGGQAAPSAPGSRTVGARSEGRNGMKKASFICPRSAGRFRSAFWNVYFYRNFDHRC